MQRSEANLLGQVHVIDNFTGKKSDDMGGFKGSDVASCGCTGLLQSLHFLMLSLSLALISFTVLQVILHIN